MAFLLSHWRQTDRQNVAWEPGFSKECGLGRPMVLMSPSIAAHTHACPVGLQSRPLSALLTPDYCPQEQVEVQERRHGPALAGLSGHYWWQGVGSGQKGQSAQLWPSASSLSKRKCTSRTP